MLDGEKDIIKRAIKGEASAFGLLYDHYQPRIYRFVFLKVSHREEAEDLTHQVFFNCWKRISDYRYWGFPFSSWLYRIARNEIIDFYRTRKNYLVVEDAIESEAELTDENSLSDALDVHLDIEKVKQAIAKLKPLEQDVLILRFIEELAPAEVALIIERTPEAVRLLQHRAIKSLREILSGNGR